MTSRRIQLARTIRRATTAAKPIHERGREYASRTVGRRVDRAAEQIARAVSRQDCHTGGRQFLINIASTYSATARPTRVRTVTTTTFTSFNAKVRTLSANAPATPPASA